MSAEIIGRVTAGTTRKSYEVKWDSASKDVYVHTAGWTHCGKASSAGEAMRKAEAYVYNK